ATTPKPTATAAETAVRTATSRGRSWNGLFTPVGPRSVQGPGVVRAVLDRDRNRARGHGDRQVGLDALGRVETLRGVLGGMPSDDLAACHAQRVTGRIDEAPGGVPNRARSGVGALLDGHHVDPRVAGTRGTRLPVVEGPDVERPERQPLGQADS